MITNFRVDLRFKLQSLPSPQAASLEDLLSLNTDFFFFPPAAVLDGIALTQLPEQAVAEGKLNAREVLL